jgi:MHS family proline/betaine transporter-like MFS transporter
VVGLAGFVLRRGLSAEAPRKGGRSPLVETARSQGPLLLKLAALSVFNSVGFYLMFVYVVSWLQLTDGIAPAKALEINTVSMVVLLPLMVTMGWLSDRIGRRRVTLAATGFAAIAAWPLFRLMHHADPGFVLLGQLGFVLAVGAFIGTQPVIMVEAVPTEVRCTAIALGYNVTVGVIGGLSPLAATWLVERTGNDYSPAFMIMAAAAVSFLAVLSFDETYRDALRLAPGEAGS